MCCTVGPCWLSVLYTVLCICQSQISNLSLPLSPLVTISFVTKFISCKEIQPVHPKGNQSYIFIGRTDAEAETSILWPPDVKGWLIGKDPDAGKDWRWDWATELNWTYFLHWKAFTFDLSSQFITFATTSDKTLITRDKENSGLFLILKEELLIFLN